jgi:hypothetical protein
VTPRCECRPSERIWSGSGVKIYDPTQCDSNNNKKIKLAWACFKIVFLLIEAYATNLSNWTGPCTSNCNCTQNVGLYCQSQQCLCPSDPNWFWSYSLG